MAAVKVVLSSHLTRSTQQSRSPLPRLTQTQKSGNPNSGLLRVHFSQCNIVSLTGLLQLLYDATNPTALFLLSPFSSLSPSHFICCGSNVTHKYRITVYPIIGLCFDSKVPVLDHHISSLLSTNISFFSASFCHFRTHTPHTHFMLHLIGRQSKSEVLGFSWWNSFLLTQLRMTKTGCWSLCGPCYDQVGWTKPLTCAARVSNIGELLLFKVALTPTSLQMNPKEIQHATYGKQRVSNYPIRYYVWSNTRTGCCRLSAQLCTSPMTYSVKTHSLV